MATLTSSVTAKNLASRVFGGDTGNRYRVVTMKTRFNTIEFFLYDAEAKSRNGLAVIVAQSETLEGVLSSIPDEDRCEFLSRRAFQKGQVALNFSQPVKLIAGTDPERGILVKCLGTGQKWYANPDKLVLIG